MKQRPFILGLQASIKESAFLNTETLCGLVGHNTGNLAFHFAIDRQLGGNLNALDWWGASDIQINAADGIAVLPCANHLGDHANFGDLAKKFKSISVPMVAIGLGAQASTDGKIPAVPEGTLDWVRVIADHAPTGHTNIGVRGNFTLEVLDHYGLAEQAVVPGCPTLFINPDPQLGYRIASNIREPKRVAVAAGHPGWPSMAQIEASIARIVTATSGSYIGQSPLEMMKLTRGEAGQLDTEILTQYRDYIAPEMDLDEFVYWTKRHGNEFFDVPAWMEHYRKFDFVIGARIHGVMLALQAGIPALCIAHDSRTLELCQTMAVPYVFARDVSQGIRRADLLKIFKFDPDAFDKNRKNIARAYVEFLKGNGLQCATWMENLCSEAI